MFKNLLIIFLLLISSFSVFQNFRFYQEIKSENNVIEVVDGDTFQLKSGKRVRLMGVDAPEYNRCGGQEAKKLLTDLILNKNVSLEEETPETFGRSMSLVFVDGKLINSIIMEKGWAIPDYRKNSRREELSKLFKFAKNKKLGIFGELCRDVKPTDECVVKGNIDKATYQKTYHLPDCRQYKQVIMETNSGDRFFCTEAEAQKAGFAKAGGCPY